MLTHRLSLLELLRRTYLEKLYFNFFYRKKLKNSRTNTFYNGKNAQSHSIMFEYPYTVVFITHFVTSKSLSQWPGPYFIWCYWAHILNGIHNNAVSFLRVFIHSDSLTIRCIQKCEGILSFSMTTNIANVFVWNKYKSELILTNAGKRKRSRLIFQHYWFCVSVLYKEASFTLKI